MRAIQLRPYQNDCLGGIRSFFAQLLRKVILCAPTGAGKTVMFSKLTQSIHDNVFYSRVYIVSNRVELITQSGGTLSAFGIHFERITADNRKINHRAWCYVAMVKTFINRMDKLPWLRPRYDRFVEVKSYEDAQRIYKKQQRQGEPEPKDVTVYTGKSGKLYVKEIADTVIIDECHYGDYKILFSHWNREDVHEDTGEKMRGPFVIGATATPLAASKNDPLSNYYQGIVNKVQISDLIDQGYLSPCITYSAKIDRSKLKKDSTGEYSDQSQMDTFATRSVYNGLLQRYQEVCNRYNQGFPMKTICFNVNISHSLEVTQMFNDAGIPCRHVDGATPKAERESIIAGYKSGAFPVICNVGILNAGFDDPTTSCIIMNRATTSVPLWLQSCGRGSRIADGKERFIILDMGDNWTELGLWSAERDWETLWTGYKRKSDKVAVTPAKTCDNCGALVNLSSRVCEVCEYEFPVKEKEFAEAAEFVEVTPDMAPQSKFSSEETRELMLLDRASKWATLDVPTLEKLREFRGRKSGWPIHIIRETSQTEEEFKEKIKELARIRNYRSGWVNHQEWRPMLTV